MQYARTRARPVLQTGSHPVHGRKSEALQIYYRDIEEGDPKVPLHSYPLLLDRGEGDDPLRPLILGDETEEDRVPDGRDARLRPVVGELEHRALLLHSAIDRPAPTLLRRLLHRLEAERAADLPLPTVREGPADGELRLRVDDRVVGTSHSIAPYQNPEIRRAGELDLDFYLDWTAL